MTIFRSNFGRRKKCFKINNKHRTRQHVFVDWRKTKSENWIRTPIADNDLDFDIWISTVTPKSVHDSYTPNIQRWLVFYHRSTGILVHLKIFTSRLFRGEIIFRVTLHHYESFSQQPPSTVSISCPSYFLLFAPFFKTETKHRIANLYEKKKTIQKSSVQGEKQKGHVNEFQYKVLEKLILLPTPSVSYVLTRIIIFNECIELSEFF